jgi:hypothetical protein
VEVAESDEGIILTKRFITWSVEKSLKKHSLVACAIKFSGT